MTTLKEPVLGTPKGAGWRFHDIHKTTSYLLREYFSTSYYRSTIKMTIGFDERLQGVRDALQGAGNYTEANRLKSQKHANELSAWAVEMNDEDFHDLHVHAFIGMWSSFEAGIENTVATFLERDAEISSEIRALCMPASVASIDVHWDKEVCMKAARKLEQKAIATATNGGVDIYARYKTMFKWLDVVVDMDVADSNILCEANQIRNILLHSYGKVKAADVAKVPALAEWEGKVMPMNQDVFRNYFNSMKKFMMALMKGAQEKSPPTAS